MRRTILALTTERLRIVIHGAVQGVGFRPFIARLAEELRLSGWVLNGPHGVEIEAEGPRQQLEQFLLRIEPEAPRIAHIQSLEAAFLLPAGYAGFAIRPSRQAGAKTALILPDLAVCASCLAEMWNPADRRYRYPFINCTHCGPRFSIILRLPYDRPNTTMRAFDLCGACRDEYESPRDRRYHAQPTCCPACGPRIWLADMQGVEIAGPEEALHEAARRIEAGQIVGLKGMGGFQLLADARNGDAVRLLRRRKQREEKPFALMVSDLHQAQTLCEVSSLEERLLASPQTPIVLLRRSAQAGSILDPSVAPRSSGKGSANTLELGPTLGVMLPCTPLHHLLMAELGFPVICTSGNLSDEPICTENDDALQRLRGIADVLLLHNRPIARHVDDSVARMLLGNEQVLRRARGYAPLPVRLSREPAPTLGMGAHLKSTAAISVERDVFLSQHLGDLETEEALRAYRRAIADLSGLYEHRTELVVHDLHPDYASSRLAHTLPARRAAVQHHAAHVYACMAENQLEPPALGVAWDGVGLGTDGTIWGGEFLVVTEDGWQRAAHLRPFRLPGGDAAARQPWRSAIGLLHEAYGGEVPEWAGLTIRQSVDARQLSTAGRMLSTGLNCPITTSAGRLFDGVAALLGLRMLVRNEGQAAVELEWQAEGEAGGPYPLPVVGSAPAVVDWVPMVRAIVADCRTGVPRGEIAFKFHAALASAIAAVAVAQSIENIMLTGGCFQNRLLTELAVRTLRARGLRPAWHQRVPPNDGGIALGQVAATLYNGYESEEV